MASVLTQDQRALVGVGEPTFQDANLAGDSFRNDTDMTALIVQCVNAMTLIISNGDLPKYAASPEWEIALPGFSQTQTLFFDSRRFNDQFGEVNFRFEDGGVPSVTGVKVAALRFARQYEEDLP